MKEEDHGNVGVIQISTDVLVVGGGLTGLNTAVRIAETGNRVILVENGQGLEKGKKEQVPLSGVDENVLEKLDALLERIEKDDLVEVLTNTKIIGAAGVTGDFHIKLSVGGEHQERVVGAIVAATDFTTKSLHETYGLDVSESVLSQTDLENILGSGPGADSKTVKKLSGKNILFLAGFAQEGNPITTKRVLKSVLAIEKIADCDVHVCIGNIKVAGDGLERLYKEGRDKGASFYKLSEMPRIDTNGKKNLVSFFDPVLRENVELEADTVVMEEAILSDTINKELAELLQIDLTTFGYLQKDNVHRFPVNSNREGIFVVGPARDTLGLPESWTDMGNVVLELQRLLEDGKKKVPVEIAVVDREKCAICLTCYRCCPHGAIYWDDKAVISPVACQACGTCASECPQDAIQVNSFKDDDISAQVEECCGEETSVPLIVAFCCRNSAVEASQMAEQFNMKLPEGLKVITVPCAGKIDIDYILTAFTQGADGVLIISCHTGNCKSETGNLFAKWRVNDAKRMLAETGIEPERLCFETLASNMGSEFSSIANSLEEKLKEMGASPVQKAG
jgi:heterodisulfide reductase subunit A-like polyferredoxin/coenzyme F420-reducing hydrogenase delta subunit